MAHRLMSLESVVDEERREVVAALEKAELEKAQRRAAQEAASAGSIVASPSICSPSPIPVASVRMPVRSMLDIGEPGDAVKKRSASDGSVSGTVSKAAPRVGAPIRSMLDIDNKPRAAVAARTKSAQASPLEEKQKVSTPTTVPKRTLSDAAARPAGFGPQAPLRSNDPSAYQFSGYLPSNPGGPVVPKRNTQAGKRSSIASAMADIVRGGDLSQFGLGGGRDSVRSRSIGSAGFGAKSKSKSPHNRMGVRSGSPRASALSLDPPKFMLDDGTVLDMKNVHERLSDANLARSGGSLAELGERSQRRRANNGDHLGSSGARLEKDLTSTDGQSRPAESSDEDDESSSDEGRRGRKKDDNAADHNGQDNDPESSTLGMGRSQGYRAPKSLLAAAEEERKQVSSRQTGGYKVRSLIIDPEIKVTGPTGERTRNKSSAIHPNTSFEDGRSGFNTPVESEVEGDITDIKRAQKLSVNMTPVFSTPLTSRCVRTIFRGDFAKMQREAQDHQRRVRKYVVATDLSPEAQHALEWTVGTVLRDGDTLLAIYCIDEETGKAAAEASSNAAEAQQKQQAEAVAASTKASATTPILGPSAGTSNFSPGFKLDPHSHATASPALAPRDRGKAEQERFTAVQDITDRVARLLRKTKLQVKVVIEVIHCKSPKHLITEVIDYINPTLVILGSRGRSALKGVILGSFSNYLVTKSSVPVMVARKRLRKHSKYKRPAIRLTNNISHPIKSLDIPGLAE